MPLNEILTWLNSKKDFNAGVQLYIKYGSNNNLIRRFTRLGNIDFNKRLLEENLKLIAKTIEKTKSIKAKAKPSPLVKQDPALQKHIEAPKIKIGVIGAALPKPHAKFIDDLSEVDFACLPDVLKTLSTRKGDLYREASIMHKELTECETDEDRAAKAKIIISNMRENDLIYQELRYYLKNNRFLGEHPQTAKPKPVKPEDDFSKLPADKLLKKISSRVAALSRMRRWAKANPKHKDIAERKKKITESETEIALMRERYDAIQGK